jgi:ferredoxin-thioredoxin reductase catalytic chain
MKRYWRCFVCNDVHYGFRPPELCPTCKVRHAYVEISPAEARTISGSSELEFDKTDFLAAIEKFAEANEFQVNPDREKVAVLLEGVFNNERSHGLKFCPCRLISKDFEEDLKLVCPCNFLIHETYQGKADGECWCGLFVRRKS